MDEREPQRSVIIRPSAVADIERNASYLEENAPADVAFRFRNAIMRAVEQIAFLPFSGAPREARNPRLQGLRMTIVPGFRNYLIFYLTPQGDVEIIRVFHGAQDVNNLLEDEFDIESEN